MAKGNSTVKKASAKPAKKAVKAAKPAKAAKAAKPAKAAKAPKAAKGAKGAKGAAAPAGKSADWQAGYAAGLKDGGKKGKKVKGPKVWRPMNSFSMFMIEQKTNPKLAALKDIKERGTLLGQMYRALSEKEVAALKAKGATYGKK